MAMKERNYSGPETKAGYPVRNIKACDVLVTAEIFIDGRWVKHSFSPDGSHMSPGLSITKHIKP